jgi:hypothetical protein
MGDTVLGVRTPHLPQLGLSQVYRSAKGTPRFLRRKGQPDSAKCSLDSMQLRDARARVAHGQPMLCDMAYWAG